LRGDSRYRLSFPSKVLSIAGRVRSRERHYPGLAEGSVANFKTKNLIG
jgi:hypothetical protein